MNTHLHGTQQLSRVAETRREGVRIEKEVKQKRRKKKKNEELKPSTDRSYIYYISNTSHIRVQCVDLKPISSRSIQSNHNHYAL
jgi:hypothetical protein